MNTSSNSIPNKSDQQPLDQQNVAPGSRATVAVDGGALGQMGNLAPVNLSTAVGHGVKADFDDSGDFGLLTSMSASHRGPSIQEADVNSGNKSVTQLEIHKFGSVS